jgi:hypothetical protein
MLLAGLSTGHTIGLSIVAANFVVFALVCSFVVPRYYPDFPGKNGIGVFAIVCVVLFIAQLTAVIIFGVEKKEKPEAQAKQTHAAAAHSSRLVHLRADGSVRLSR